MLSCRRASTAIALENQQQRALHHRQKLGTFRPTSVRVPQRARERTSATLGSHLSFCSCLAFLLAAALSFAKAFSTVTPLARETRSPPRQLFLSVSSFTA